MDVIVYTILYWKYDLFDELKKQLLVLLEYIYILKGKIYNGFYGILINVFEYGLIVERCLKQVKP